MLRRVAVLRCGGRSALRQRALASKSHAHGRSVEPVGSEQHQTLDAATKTGAGAALRRARRASPLAFVGKTATDSAGVADRHAGRAPVALGRHLPAGQVHDAVGCAVRRRPCCAGSASLRKRVAGGVCAGKDLKKKWKLAFPGSETWRNPLMGWTSSGDPLSSMEMMFTSKEDGTRGVVSRGWALRCVRAEAKRHTGGARVVVCVGGCWSLACGAYHLFLCFVLRVSLNARTRQRCAFARRTATTTRSTASATTRPTRRRTPTISSTVRRRPRARQTSTLID